jgi:large subunit ribosomal protein L10
MKQEKPVARESKTASVAEITEEFRSSSAAVLTEYRGLSVTQLKELRRSIADVASYAVVKNTLTRIAAREAGVEGLDDLLVGPSAIAFVKGDPVTAAKGLRDFAKANPALVLKGGYMDGRVLDAAEITKLADLESREVLLAKMAGAMKASMSQAVGLFNAPLSQAARLFAALQEKLPAEQAAPAPAAEEAAPAPEAVEDAPESPAEQADAPAPVTEAPAAEDAPHTPEATAEGTTEG